MSNNNKNPIVNCLYFNSKCHFNHVPNDNSAKSFREVINETDLYEHLEKYFKNENK